MRIPLGVCLAVWVLGCAHSPGKTDEPAAQQDGRVQELLSGEKYETAEQWEDWLARQPR